MEKNQNSPNIRPSNRMPENSTLYEKVVPVMLVIMSVVTVGLILFAVGVLTGLVTF